MTTTTQVDLAAEVQAAAEAKAAEMLPVEIKTLCEITGFSETTIRRIAETAFMHGALWMKRRSASDA